MLYAAFTSLLAWRLGATWFLPVGHFSLRHLPARLGPLPLLCLGEGRGGIQVHPTGFTLEPVQICKRVAIEKQAHTIYG